MKTTADPSLTPYSLNLFADSIMEECSRLKLGLRGTMDRLLPAVAGRLGAGAAALETRDEDLRHRVFSWKSPPSFDLAAAPGRLAERRSGGLTWVTRPLDLDGRRVGTFALAFRGRPPFGEELPELLRAVCEELDNALWGIHGAAVKQKLMERVTGCLTRSVLRDALDEAVKALHAEIPFRHLGLVYRNEDAEEGDRIQYRFYRGTECAYDSELRPHAALSRAIGRLGLELLDPGQHRVRRILRLSDGASFTLSGRAEGAEQLGKLVAEAEGGLSPEGRDLMQIFANSISQRLIDYNRERRHMAKFFSPETVSRLLRGRDYMRRHLKPRVKTVGMLYADINSFTKLCEKALRTPERIGEFVDSWSEGAVRLIWKHGGVFDKMVGDCVIAIFGPPFFDRTQAECARRAALAALEIQEFTAGLGRLKRNRGLAAKAGARGLGVAVGINLCPAAVGLFGPNHDFTAFSSGMNQTARLQSKAGFREILVMASAKDALERSGTKAFRFEGPFEAEAKNVEKPLRYYRLLKARR
ncbi:MAG: adenylate/guanylate cyclase domain-containing protein [Elusimicrobia bacterium]|nr:adenylate/guanylate cyclase domain-containing protein [Elusimicrobiota bacterium]